MSLTAVSREVVSGLQSSLTTNTPGERRLPPELEREIFELAAYSNFSFIPTLLLLAWRVHSWIERLLFEVVVLNRSKKAAAFVAQSTRYAPFVRHLFFDMESEITPEAASSILQHCTNVHDFATIGQYSHPSILPILANMRIERLAICFEVLFGSPEDINLCHPFLVHVTHLDVFDMLTDKAIPLICDVLPQLPSLSHLCLNNERAGTILDRVLSSLPNLVLLVVLRPGAVEAMRIEEDPPVADDRLVFGTFRDYWGQWEACASGQPNFWTAAESIVLTRKRKRLQANCETVEESMQELSVDGESPTTS
ncbi:hypothetical protein MKEN_00998600 [Mycena kentingensis (nom. inval.)]|nr:hypothetical protein MKEN_00998600 [Mycena kentingensis (nom. inval.)]